MLKEAVALMAEKIDGELFRWIVGGLLTLISTLGGYWLTHLTNRLDTVTRDFYDRGQRISALEAHIDSANRRLDRIDQKQDAILEKLTRK